MMNKFDLQNDDYNYLDDLMRGRARGELLEAAVEKDVFSRIGSGKKEEEMADLLGLDEEITKDFLQALAKLGLVGISGGYVFNTPVAARYLDRASHLWSVRSLTEDAAPQKFLAEKIAPYFADISFDAPILVTAFDDDGAAFTATMKEYYSEITVANGESPSLQNCSLVVVGKTYNQDGQGVADNGYLAVLGEFADIDSEGAAMNRLHRSFRREECPLPPSREVREFLKKQGFVSTVMLPLTDTAAVIFAARSEEILEKLTIDPLDRLEVELKQKCKIRSTKRMNPNDVVLARWVADHCRFGCSTYGEKCCPPNSPGWEQTKERLGEYQNALLIEGEPPTGDFQKMMLQAEKTAFKAGYYKAFVLWSGPCSLCTECNPPAPPKKCTATRPSMESSGIDVFATVRKQGYQLRTLKDKTEFVKYFGLLVLE